MTATVQQQWQRFSLAERMSRYAVYLVVVTAFVWSVRTVEVIPEFLLDAPEQMMDLFRRMWPLDFEYYPTTVHQALLETINIATLGTLFTLPLAVPLALLNSRRLCRSKLLNTFAQFCLVSSRSVNSLVWALIFVAMFGPGVFAGMLAIAFRSVGFVGKLLAEALDEVDNGCIEALRATGASRSSILIKGYWPQVKPAFYSIVLFRWDINVRESAVLGLVGAGGIGVVLNDSLNLFEWTRVSMVLASIFAVVILTEILVVKVRSRLI